mgnify:CR=1 FL=1
MLPIGYGDGFPRVRNTGGALIHGRRAPLIGGIAMDALMVDITDIPEDKLGEIAHAVNAVRDNTVGSGDRQFVHVDVRLPGAQSQLSKFLLGNGTLPREALDFLAACVAGRLSILISGGTGAGKTTLLNALSAWIPHGERVVTIEDSAELRLQQPHVVRLEYRPPNIEGKGAVTIRDLVTHRTGMSRNDLLWFGDLDVSRRGVKCVGDSGGVLGRRQCV